MRQLVTESVLIAALGGAAGLVLASLSVRALMGLAPGDLPHRELVGIDAVVVLFSLAVTAGSCLAFGLVPAWHAAQWDVNRSMKEDPASRSTVTRGALVAGQLALALVLLVGAGLLARTFISLRQAPLGYDPSRLLTAHVQLTFSRFRERDARLAFYDRVAAAVRALPGVEAVGFAVPGPLDGLTVYRRVAVDGQAAEIATYQPTVLPGYFDAMRIRLRDGRDFLAGEKTTRDRTPIIVDDGLARLLVPDGRAVGQRVLLSPHASSEQWAEIVGVVDHVRVQDVRNDGLPQLYVSFDHRQMFNSSLVVRTSGDPHAMTSAVKQTVEQLGPGRPVHKVAALQDLVDAQRADTRFALLVLTVFAALALVLTAIGVYGVVAYATSRRTREIALRLALGADARTIVALVVREGALWTALGLTAGIVGARVLTQSLTALLVDVTPGDPVTFAAVVALVAATAIVATIIPALRAVRVDPMLALRAE
jgi:putative ABC transport system permease protein